MNDALHTVDLGANKNRETTGLIINPGAKTETVLRAATVLSIFSTESLLGREPDAGRYETTVARLRQCVGGDQRQTLKTLA